MDKKYIFGIFIAFIVLADIGIILLNPGVLSNAQASHDLYTSPPVDCCSGMDNNSTNISVGMNTSTCEARILRNGTRIQKETR